MSQQFLIKYGKFNADNVIFKEDESKNGKPLYRISYKYENGSVGPLNIQMSEMVAKQGVIAMSDKGPISITDSSNDQLVLSFSDNENFTPKEQHFITEYHKMEERYKALILPEAVKLFDNLHDEHDDNYKKQFINGQYSSSISYSTEKDPKTGKKTKKRDNKYTSLKLKMYKNQDSSTDEWYYQGSFIPFENTKEKRMSIENTLDIIPKWSKIMPIISLRSTWIMAAAGTTGIHCLASKLKVTSISSDYSGVDFEPESDEDVQLATTKDLDSEDEDNAESDLEDQLDKIAIAPVVVPEPKPATKRRTVKAK